MRAGLPSEGTPQLDMTDAAGRLVLSIAYKTAMHVPLKDAFVWRSCITITTKTLDVCVTPWPARRVEHDLVRTFGQQTELTAMGRSFLLARWVTGNTISMACWAAWVAGTLQLLRRPMPSLPHPLSVLAPRPAGKY